MKTDMVKYYYKDLDTGWKALSMKQYHPDFLDEIFMHRTEDAYHYGKRKE